jgi:hypothetical protein
MPDRRLRNQDMTSILTIRSGVETSASTIRLGHCLQWHAGRLGPQQRAQTQFKMMREAKKVHKQPGSITWASAARPLWLHSLCYVEYCAVVVCIVMRSGREHHRSAGYVICTLCFALDGLPTIPRGCRVEAETF